MATTSDYIAAAADPDLRARLVATLAANGHPSPESAIQQRLGEIVAASVGGSSELADVHAYAVASYDPTPAPGADLTKVTDIHLVSALRAVRLIPEEE